MARRLAEAEAAGQGMRARLAALTRLNSDLSRSLAGREAGSAAVAALQARTAELEGQLADQSKEVGRLEVCPGITNTPLLRVLRALRLHVSSQRWRGGRLLAWPHRPQFLCMRSWRQQVSARAAHVQEQLADQARERPGA